VRPDEVEGGNRGLCGLRKTELKILA